MYSLTDICFLCLKNNIKVQSVLFEDTDGIIVNEKLRFFFPDIIDSIPDVHKLACLECLEKLRISYDFKLSVIRNNSVFKNYIDKLQCQNKSQQQLLAVMVHSKHRENISITRDSTAKEVENSLEVQNECFNLTSTNQQHTSLDESCLLTSNENKSVLTKYNCQDTNLEIENIEIVDPLEIKQERLDDEFLTNYLDESTLKTHDQSYQQPRNENDATFTSFQLQETNLETEDIEEIQPLPEEVYIKQEPFAEDDFPSHYSDEESKESEEANNTLNDSDNDEHPKEKNVNLRIFKCNECHKAFPRRSVLEAHGRIHSGERPYKCEICQKAFTQAVTLNTHKLTHTGEKPHQCDICNKTFNRKDNLIRHKRSHNTVRPYQCSVCNKAFTLSDNLTKHMLLHTGKKSYRCRICQFKCADGGSLKRHTRLHTGEKPYECSVCNKMFTQSGTLTRHMRTHTGETPYMCEHCEMRFTRSSNLNIHIQRFHT